MILPAGEVVEIDALWKTIVAALAAGVGVALTFSVALLGWVRAKEARRDNSRMESVLWIVVGVLGLTACAAGIVLGIIVMTDK